MPQLILADRSDLFRRSMTSVLKGEGYEVIHAENGSKVLNLVLTSKPAAIILDTEVEGPSGLETLRILKADPQLRKLPVLVVSRESEPTSVSNAFKQGAEAFLLKPVDINALIKTLDGLRVPTPALNAPIEVVSGEATLVGKLRFIDQYGQLYLDKEAGAVEQLAAIGARATISFESGKLTFQQAVLIDEENEVGLSLVPIGPPSTKSEPELARVRASFKCRYLLPGSFMRLADIHEITGEGFTIRGVNAEPKFNTPIQITLFPRGGGSEGIAIDGRVVGFANGAEPGTFEVEVAFKELPGLPYVHLMAELIGGRPPRQGAQEAS